MSVNRFSAEQYRQGDFQHVAIMLSYTALWRLALQQECRFKPRVGPNVALK